MLRAGCGAGRGIKVIKDDMKLYSLADAMERSMPTGSHIL
jgi:hypothetical protein